MDTLKTDENGHVILSPIHSVYIEEVMGESILIAVQFAETNADLEAGRLQVVQLHATPRECIRIANRMREKAERVLQRQSIDSVQ